MSHQISACAVLHKDIKLNTLYGAIPILLSSGDDFTKSLQTSYQNWLSVNVHTSFALP